ncbi:hypothetical protein EMIHUDRAFT_448273 [Emiliania huxleyi CCMP1516]|uniref:Uncharacterized protein n=2 Tax=Emiliania huxleyi TaxID=2903 RepID=A0A0D3IUG3_EMIH1|nr:hypothetical protein EMIHUDRAFT_448273 [Emiliania huxleyi CCMP1516]EOD14898.1 hypothetical protein EMIHUDRAFT_448273 [Emiliania huxleyi CCMP1516]|eukprot:XP_005767327.1 hypothetical protein EMIHUDRAFT_448273 [Emiliania huxleyi CCMP1516]
MKCGCLGPTCCGICGLADVAGRPRLTRDNAAQWTPPPLPDKRNEDKAAERNADDGLPTLWFWQMEGYRWPLDAAGKGIGRIYNTASRAWTRLAGDDDFRADETGGRYLRADAQREREKEQERAEEAQQWAETAAADQQARRSRVEQRRAADDQICSRHTRVSAPRAAREDVRGRRLRQWAKRFRAPPSSGDESSEDDDFKLQLSLCRSRADRREMRFWRRWERDGRPEIIHPPPPTPEQIAAGLIEELVCTLEYEARKAEVIADGATLYNKNCFRIDAQSRRHDDDDAAFVAYPDGSRSWVHRPFRTTYDPNGGNAPADLLGEKDPRLLVMPWATDYCFREPDVVEGATAEEVAQVCTLLRSLSRLLLLLGNSCNSNPYAPPALGWLKEHLEFRRCCTHDWCFEVGVPCTVDDPERVLVAVLSVHETWHISQLVECWRETRHFKQIVEPIVQRTGRDYFAVWNEQYKEHQAQSPCLRSSRDVRLGLEQQRLACGQHHLRPLQPVCVRVRPRRDSPATEAIAREKGVFAPHLPNSEAAFKAGLSAKAQKWEQRYVCICGASYEEMLLVARSDDIARQSREVYHEIRRQWMIEEERKEQEREEAIQRKRQRVAEPPPAEHPLGLPSGFDNGVVPDAV